jgi:hypothetical protein
MPAGNREIEQLGLVCDHFDAGERGVEDFVVKKGADQLAYPASGALGRKDPFFKDNPF